MVVASEAAAPHGNLKMMMKTGLQAAISIPSRLQQQNIMTEKWFQLSHLRQVLMACYERPLFCLLLVFRYLIMWLCASLPRHCKCSLYGCGTLCAVSNIHKCYVFQILASTLSVANTNVTSGS